MRIRKFESLRFLASPLDSNVREAWPISGILQAAVRSLCCYSLRCITYHLFRQIPTRIQRYFPCFNKAPASLSFVMSNGKGAMPLFSARTCHQSTRACSDFLAALEYTASSSSFSASVSPWPFALPADVAKMACHISASAFSTAPALPSYLCHLTSAVPRMLACSFSCTSSSVIRLLACSCCPVFCLFLFALCAITSFTLVELLHHLLAAVGTRGAVYLKLRSAPFSLRRP